MNVSTTLAGAEARRLLRSPAFLVALGLSCVFLAWGPGRDDIFLRYKILVGAGLDILAAGTGVALGLAASRSRRSGTDELFASLPAPAASRTTAQLLAAGASVAVGIGLLLALAVRMQAWNGLAVPSIPGTTDPGRLTPTVVALAQGPALVALAGVVGVALGLWVRSAAVWATAVVGGFYFAPIPMLFWSWDRRRWLLPMADGLDSGGYVMVGPQRPVLVVYGADTTAMAWHVLYVIALVVVVALFAVRRHRPVRRLPCLAAGGLGAIAGTLQVITAS